MENGDSPRRPSSVISKPTAPISASSQDTVGAPLQGGRLQRVHTVTPSVIHSLPGELRSRQSRLFGNKVVLGFEEEFTIARAREWARLYNQKRVLPLAVCHELPNARFVVQFDNEDLPAAKRLLLASSPLGAGEVFASVNDYTIAFDPCNQGDVRHLITVNIPRGNPAFFDLITFITSISGTFVKGVLGADDRHISVVAETTLKLFPAHGQYSLLDDDVTTIYLQQFTADLS